MVFELVNVSGVIRKHFSSLCEDSKVRWVILLFIVLPSLVPIYLLFLEHIPLGPSSAGALITAYSLFSGLLLSVVVFLFNIVVAAAKELEIQNKKSKSRILVEHLYANSLYSVIVAISTLAVLVFGEITNLWSAQVVLDLWLFSLPLLDLVSGIVYFMTVHFLMTLLMIVKRLSALLSKQLEMVTETTN